MNSKEQAEEGGRAATSKRPYLEESTLSGRRREASLDLREIALAGDWEVNWIWFQASQK